MTPAEVIGLITAVAGGLFGAWQWIEKQNATRRKEEAQANAEREKIDREKVEFAFARYQSIIGRLESTNEKAIARLDTVQEEHQKCREELAGLKKTAEWQASEMEQQRETITDLRGRVDRLEAR